MIEPPVVPRVMSMKPSLRSRQNSRSPTSTNLVPRLGAVAILSEPMISLARFSSGTSVPLDALLSTGEDRVAPSVRDYPPTLPRVGYPPEDFKLAQYLSLRAHFSHHLGQRSSFVIQTSETLLLQHSPGQLDGVVYQNILRPAGRSSRVENRGHELGERLRGHAKGLPIRQTQ